MPTATLTEQLDKLEANLPTVSARVLRLQRTLAGAAYDRTAAIVTTVAENTKAFLDTARISGKTVTGQARAAGGDVRRPAPDQDRPAGRAADSDRAARSPRPAGHRPPATSPRRPAPAPAPSRGQAGAQGKKVSKAAAEPERPRSIDSAIDAVEDKPGLRQALRAVDQGRAPRAGPGARRRGPQRPQQEAAHRRPPRRLSTRLRLRIRAGSVSISRDGSRPVSRPTERPRGVERRRDRYAACSETPR